MTLLNNSECRVLMNLNLNECLWNGKKKGFRNEQKEEISMVYARVTMSRLAWLEKWVAGFGSKRNLHILGRILSWKRSFLSKWYKKKPWFSHMNNPIINVTFLMPHYFFSEMTTKTLFENSKKGTIYCIVCIYVFYVLKKNGFF